MAGKLEEEVVKEVRFIHSQPNDESNANDKDVYFIILRPSEEKIDFTGLHYETKKKITPLIAFKKRIDKEDKTYLEEIVFKFKKKGKKKEPTEWTDYAITFFEGDHTYDITFSLKDQCFVYQPNLKTGNKFLDNILKEPIKQNIVPLFKKLNIFLEVLDKNNETKKEKKLYEDTIALYKDKKEFSLLITLFLKIYEKNKDLCDKLIRIFYKINEEENNDRLNDLKDNLNLFQEIYSKAKDIIEKNNYNPIHFYAVLFCYLHYYDKANFPNIIEDFSMGNSDTLYEILIQYYSHFTNPLKQKKEFYDKFIKYALKTEKELKIFRRILNYVEDIETFLFIINSNIEQIFKKYDKLKIDPIKMTANLKLVKYKIDKTKKVGTTDKIENTINEDSDDNDEEDNTKRMEKINNIINECDTITELIEKIIEFSKREKILAIYMKSTFWINLIKEYNIPDWENISNCHKLRKIYKEYNKLINSLYEESAKGPKKSKGDDNDIKSDINRYYERDEFAFILNKNIKDFFANNSKKIKNAEILGTVAKYNPYFSIDDEEDKKKYKNNKETYIFDYINFSQTTDSFNGTFQNLEFEIMFEEIITDYINKITGKIKDIQTFGNIIKLIKVERIKEQKQKDYFRILEEKYKLIIKNEIKLIKDKDKELQNAIKIITEFVSKLFLFEKNTRFLKEEISILDEEIKSLIYIELITTYKDKCYEDQKNCIYDIYLEKMDTKEGRNNIIKLVKNLKDDDRKFFIYEKLLEKCQFSKEDFFSNVENYQIQTLCLLIEELNKESQEEDKKKKKEVQKDEEKDKNNEVKLNILSQQGNIHAKNLITILDDIIKNLDRGLISKKVLEKFLNIKKYQNPLKTETYETKKVEEEKEEKKSEKKNDNDESGKYVKDKLELITLILANYDPNTKYAEYKSNIEKINEKVKILKFIKDSLMIFHRNLYNEEIKKITNILDEIENSSIQKFKMEETRKTIESLEAHMPLCEEIKKVKDFLLFKKIFENAQGKNQAELFADATKKLSGLKESFKKNSSNIESIFNDPNYVNTFKDIKEELGRKSESKSKDFIDQMIDYFSIKSPTSINDLKMIINSKKYEMIVKSIKYFFDNISGKKLILPGNIILSEMDLKKLKITLEDLKRKNIYDYEQISPYYRVFTSIYEKKEAIDFLISKLNTNTKELGNELKDKLDPTNRSISIKDIDDTIDCLNHFKAFINYDSPKIINYIKDLKEEQIKQFESFSKKFGSIIELDTKNEKDPFKEVYDIIQDASLLFNLDNEDFGYNIDGKFIRINNIEELIKLKNKINIQPQKKIKENGEKKNETKEEKEEKEKDPFEIKCDKLLFFKNIITNLEIIYDKINILRTKGFNLPIVINIAIKYPKVSYKLNNKVKEFNKIKDYLFEVKNDYENQLNIIYENEKYLRLLYGKLFRKVKQHQEGNYEIPEMIRYILNKPNNKDKIQDGELSSLSLGDDYEEQFHDHTQKVFNSISKYLISLFKNNDLDFNKHYDNMKIKEENKYKGISIKKCKNESTGEYILSLFINIIGKLPISQNILICSKETSIEEIQSFLYRAILCEYNTLFTVEILDSFSNFQHNKMYSYIDKLLSIKLEKYKNENKDNKIKDIDKSKTRDYLDSYIVFAYKDLENEFAFITELEKYTKKNKTKEENYSKKPSTSILTDTEKKMGDLNISNISIQSIRSIQENDMINNIKVISSDICGLGKSFKIKKMIKEEKKIYYPFPLGGKLTKNVIYQKISNLFKKIKKDAKNMKKEVTQKDKNDKDKKDEEYSEFNNVAIHLDLIETKETSLINEFLFLFLITKFYTNNEDIIYIPNNIKIYIEVPNSFEDYLTKFGILNAFNRLNITLRESKKNETNNITNIPMLPLELDPKIRNKFKNLNGFKNDEEIEKFIKENFNSINIEEYSYHQVQTFINLYISQFESFNSKLQFKNYKGNDITQECIKYFAESTKYFTNGGFAKLIMKKKKINDIFELCLDAYENDLSKAKFETPLIFYNKEKSNFILEKLPDISEEEKNNQNQQYNKIYNKEVDICFVIDGTGSMTREIKAAKDYVIKIFKDLKDKYKENDFQFGAIFYRDKVYTKEDLDEYYPLTNKIEKELQSNISKVRAYGGGGDLAEDWAGGYELALNKMNWRNGIKLIIHICDDGAHGEQFTEKDPFYDEGEKLIREIKECVNQNINIIGLKIGQRPEKSFQKISEIYNDYKIISKDNGQFIEVYKFDGRNTNTVSENFYNLVMQAANQVINPSYKYLKRLKNILYLPNDLEKDIDNNKSLLSILEKGSTDNYVITDDNYKKMILLIYRIKANVPVIIMGETGCGKTSLIKKLSQILNNGEELVKVININPAITDEKIMDEMKKMNEEAKKQEKKELWVFFDEINTCLSLSLLTEIFINRTFNGEKLEDNIRLVGACNPYRKRKELIERCGLTREDDEDDQLVYKVEQLPQSLLYYVFSFGSLSDKDEKKYIRSIIQILFNQNEEKLRDLTTEAISKCHIFLRESFGHDPSIVSLREIARFKTCVEFFIDYFPKKNDQIKNNLNDETIKLYKIKSIICSIYLCYYIRLINDDKRGKFDALLQKTLLQIVNVHNEEQEEEETRADLKAKIKYERLSQELREKKFEKFSDLLKIEEEFLLEQIELDKGIGKNQLLKENLFLLFLAVVTKIPLIIVGKPGTGKSLSTQLILNSMRGKYSKPKDGKKSFFTKYPQINQIYFQGSESTTPEDVEELFKKANDLYKNYKIINNNNNSVPIYMILFDELGLAEKSPTNPLKVLHSKLEYGGKKEGTCFIGISNYSLDSAKVNRALNLSVPNLEDKLEQLKSTSKSIVESVSDDIYNNNLIFDILARAYNLYKYYLNFMKEMVALKQYDKQCKKLNKHLKGKSYGEIKTDQEFIKILKKDKTIKSEFHGNRDFYNIIKGVAIEGSRLSSISDEKQIVPIINNFIERNFGGISYDIDIDFNLVFDDIKLKMETLKEKILNEKLNLNKDKGRRGEDDDDDEKKNKNEDTNIKVTSVFLFKKIFNEACVHEKPKEKETTNGKIYQIPNDYLDKYDLNRCINDNINDNNSRYLLLEIRSNIAPLINQIIRAQSSYRKDIDTIIGSPFPDDNNSDYKAKKVNEIQNCASQEDKLIILQNLDPIQPYLYDLYNKNYKVIDDQKFVRICLDNFSEQLTPVDDSFIIIVLVDRRFVDKVDMAFLNRLEKMQISFKDLLGKRQKDLIKNIQEEARLKEEIKEERNKFNYNLNNLLINCTDQDIGGLVYYFFLEAKKENINENIIKDKIYTKISNLLPQDIIVILPEGNPIKKKYYDKKKYYNFNQYMKAFNAKDKDLANYKISIIYTFSNIANIIEGYHNDNEFMISAINTEEKLKTYIDDIKTKNEADQKQLPILIRFEDYHSNKIQFITDYINNYCKEDEYHYIFIIYLHRDFSDEKKQRIHSIPNIYKNINQLFIDNLEGPDITLKNLITKDVKDIMFSAEVFRNLDKEFREILTSFVYEKIADKNKIILEQNSKMSDLFFYLNPKYEEKNNINEENYSEEIIKYMLYIDPDFKNKIIEKAKELIEMDKDTEADCNSLINKMFKENYVNKNKIDIISCILDYIKENVFAKYLKLIFNELEDNNLLTTLLEINNNNSCKLDKNDKGPRPNNSKIIKELETKFLKEIKVDNDKKYEPKFLSNYKVPGFYRFYKTLSDYLTKDIDTKFLNKELKLRNIDLNKDPKPNIAKELEDFHEKEEELLKKVLEKIEKDKIYFDLINKITPDLILQDYITFYLEKYLGIYSKPFYNIILLLLDIRFSNERNIVKENIENPLNIVIIKIMWIESNSNYIEEIMKAFELGKDIINDNEGSIFYQMIFDKITDKENPINYIENKDRYEHMREINECFYQFLAGLCLSATTNDMDKMELSVGSYCGILKDIYKIIKNINDDLNTYLNELYIIDELTKIIDYNPNTQKKIIEEIRNNLTENAIIIQKNHPNKNTKLIENFKNMNEKIKQIKNEQTKVKYYDTLKYIYKKEIEKVKDKVYCSAILEEIINEKEIIKISNDIFRLLLESYTDLKEFKYIKDDLLKSKDNIIKLLNKKLSDDSKDYYLALSETLIYFFEGNSLIYLKDFSDIETFEVKKGHVKVFKECNEFLQKIHNNNISEGNRYITELFCLGYIKAFCYIFIKMHDKDKFIPENIIKIINENDKINMVKLYIYKIIYNKNNKQINAFLNSEIIKKYNLNAYTDFNKFINKEEIEKLELFSYDNNSNNAYYKNLYKNLEEHRKNKFEDRITMEDISPNKKIKFDDFFMVANNLILSKLNNENFENDESYINFYLNVCEPLYRRDNDDDNGSNKLIALMKFLFEKDTYKEIKKEYSIDSKDIDALLYGYRYCLNEVKDKEEDYIYSYLYNQNNLSDFDQKFYPGNDNNNKEEPYYELYNKIVNHFKEKPNEGCYVCLCDKGYYHSVPSGFPGFSETNMKCDKCNYEIGAVEYYRKEIIEDNDKNKEINVKTYETVQSNDNYYRIFKNNQEINDLKTMKEYYKNFEKMKYMTLEDFKNQYIRPLYSKEKGLNIINIDDFKKNNKIIRNLSEISYRLLNYILYCHLFFAKLYTQSEKFDNYKPKEMSWISVIKNCFTKLKAELEKKDIKHLGIFMNCIFKELFNKLHNKECINNFEDLINFEDELEKLIQEKCEKAKEEINQFKQLEKDSIKDEKSSIALIKEIYDKNKYNNRDYPFYEHFYYTDYLDEDYIQNLLKDKDENDYPVLVKYLQFKKQKKSKDKDKYSLDNLIPFNKVLQLFNDNYSNQISRDFAEKKMVKDSELYQDKKNSKLVDDFIILYNSLELSDEQGNKLELNVEKNCICDFLLIDDNKYGKSYTKIYKIFIENQNKELVTLLDKKIDSGVFNINCKLKINVQQIKEKEIFTLPKKSKVLFNSSYRKYIDTKKHENYNEYIIKLEQIEAEMTNSFLKNKKLLNDKLIKFNFNNEVFSYEINDLITNFAYEKNNITIDDKEIIYNFIKDNNGNKMKYKEIINNFITLIDYLNIMSKDQNNKINANTKICDIEIVKNLKNISNDFLEIFLDKQEGDNKKEDENIPKANNLNVSKITNIFDYFLKLIFKYVKEDIIKYQKKNKDAKSTYNLEDKDMVIKKKDLASAIRIFITLVLFREKEKDKDNKIKSNKKNIIDYLKNKDLWESSLYNNSERFEQNLSQIKGLYIKIKEILFFYYYLVDNKDEGFEDEIVNHINKREEEKKKQKEIEEQLKKEEEKQSEVEKEVSSDDDDSDDDDDWRKRRKSSDDSDDDDGRRKKRKRSDDSDDDDDRNKKRKRRRDDDD